MPSYITHYSFADQVRRQAPPAAVRACETVPAAYFWGSQGPDPFFFALGNGHIMQLGGRMHRTAVLDVFQAMAEAVGDSAAAFAYLLGYCTHYALDRAVHPYIEDQAHRLSVRYRLSESAAHKFCEADLDAAVLLADGRPAPAAVPAFRLLDLSCCDAAARMLAVGGNAAGGTVTAGQAERAMRTMRKVYGMLHYSRRAEKILRVGESLFGQLGMLSAMIRPNRLLPEDSLNRAHRVWLDWEGRSCREDFYTLVERDALPDALVLQRAVCAACRLGRPLPGQLFRLDYGGKKLPDDHS